MKSLTIFILSLSFLFLNIGFSQAQGKVGYFDLQAVLPQLPEYKEAQSTMETYAKQIEEEMQSKKTEFESKLQDYQTKLQSGELTPAIRQAKERELQSLDRQYADFQQRVQTDIQSREQKLLNPIYEKIEGAIKDVASTKSYAYILKAESCAATVKAEDISNDVLRKLGVTPSGN